MTKVCACDGCGIKITDSFTVCTRCLRDGCYKPTPQGLPELRVEFDELADPEFAVWSSKGADYTIGNSDRLFNFKWISELVGITPAQVWAVFFLKHVAAAIAWAKTGKTESEGIDGRLIDIANYGKLGRLIAKEGK